MADTSVITKEAQLQEIKVSAFRRIGKATAEKTVYELNNQLPQSLNADRVLALVPGVAVTNKGIKLSGNKQNVRLLIDGVDAVGTELKDLKAADIKCVEVSQLNTWDTDYEGTINIIRKRSTQQQVGGCVTLATGTLRKDYYIAPKLDYKDSKTDARVSVHLHNTRQENEFSMQRRLNDGTEQSFMQENDLNAWQNDVIASISFFPSKRWSATAQYMYFGFSHDNDALLNNTRKQNITSRHHRHTANTVVRYDLSTRSKIFLKGGYRHYASKNEVRPTSIQPYDANMDEYAAELSEESDSLTTSTLQHKLAAGVKWVWRNNHYSAQEKACHHVGSFYLNDNTNIGRQWSVRLILQLDMAKFQQPFASNWHETTFLPALTLNRNLPHGNMMLTANCTVRRPSIDQLSPATYYNNEVEQTVGNSTLKSQHNYRLRLDYYHQTGHTMLGANASHKLLHNGIEGIYCQNLNRRIFENATTGSVTSFGLNTSTSAFDYRLFLNFIVQAEYYALSITDRILPYAESTGNNGWAFFAYLSALYTTKKGWMWNFTANLSTHERTLSETTQTKCPYTSLRVSKQLNKRVELALTCDCLFGLNQTTTTYHFRTATERSKYNYHTSNIHLSLTWNFGRRFQERTVSTAINTDDIELRH